MLRKAKKNIAGEEGFTLVELMVVVIISMIMIAAMVGILKMAFDSLTTSRNLQAINDVSRKTLGTMSRQIKEILHLDNDNCDEDELSFYADVTGTCSSTADTTNYADAAFVQYTHSSGTSEISATIQQPGGDPNTQVLGADVKDLRFYYFLPNTLPGPAEDPTNPAGYEGADKNYNVGLIRIVLELKKGKISRTYYQDVDLRTIDRPKS